MINLKSLNSHYLITYLGVVFLLNCCKPNIFIIFQKKLVEEAGRIRPRGSPGGHRSFLLGRFAG
jgi:hypothetical protein